MRAPARPLALVLPIAALLLSACPAPEPLDIPDGCNPLASEVDCMLPFPTDFFRVPDATLPGGHRVVLPAVAAPHTVADDGAPLDPVDLGVLHPTDGASVLPPILALFGVAIDEAPLVFLTDDLNESLSPQSPTVLLDAESGEPVMHFAELDPRAESDAARALVIRAVARLEFGRRYVVGIHGLTSPAGAPIEAPEGFRRIRDKETRKDPVLDPLADRFADDVFAPLETFGVERSDLQLAWDFTVQSDERTRGDLLRMRELLLAELASAPPAVTVTAVTDDVDVNVFRRIEGTLTVPSFLPDLEPGSPLFRDGDGRVARNGTIEVPFLVLVPRSVGEGAAPIRPARFLQFGHGFFGNRTEIDGDFVSAFAERTGMVVGAVDWLGMSSVDRGPVIVDMLEDTPNALRFLDRTHQGMVNHLALAAAARTSLAALPELQDAGTPLYDTSEVFFYGLSMGHILGGTFLALSPDVRRGTLSSGGTAMAHIMFRSLAFGAFLIFLEQVMPSPLDQQKFAAMTQSSFDRIDSIAWAPYVRDTLLPGSPASREVLMHTGLGDPAVPNVAAEVHARALGLPLLEPALRPVAGLSTVSAPHDGSALMEFDFGLPEPLPGTYADISWPNNEVHEAVRRLDAAQAQVDAFLAADGEVIQPCDGVCDPE